VGSFGGGPAKAASRIDDCCNPKQATKAGYTEDEQAICLTNAKRLGL
jgi:hypothetical protein